MFKQERKYLWKRTQFQIFVIAPENRDKERAWGRVGVGRRKLLILVQTFPSCGKYTFMFSSPLAMSPRASSLPYISSRPPENVHKIYCLSFSPIVYKTHRNADNAFQYPTTWTLLKRSLFFRWDLTQWHKIIPTGALERPNPRRMGFKRKKKIHWKPIFYHAVLKKIPPTNI